MVNGIPKIGPDPTPYKKSELTPNLGVQDEADDIRGGMGLDGLMNLYQFVRDGGLLIVEGSTSTIFPDYKLVNGITVESPEGLFVRGSIMRGVVADAKSPIVYGYEGTRSRCTSARIPCWPWAWAAGAGAAGPAAARRFPAWG